MIVVDASVAIKWAVDEPGRQSALTVLDFGQPMYAPDLIVAEAANVFAKKERLGEVTPELTAHALLAIREELSLVACAELVDDATAFARRFRHSVYDCFYLALAVSRGVLVTADDKFLNKIEGTELRAYACSPDELGGRLIEPEPLPKMDAILTEVERLVPLVDETWRALSPVGRAGKVTLENIRRSDPRPLYDSPAYRRLTKVLERCSTSDLARLVALGWLGRSYYSHEDWPHLLARATQMADEGMTMHGRYFVAQMVNVSAGLSKLRAAATSP